jgi:hypothetical protein
VCEFVIDPTGFWQAITTLAGRLQEGGLVDYDHQRQVLSTLVRIDAAVWRPVFAEHGGRLMPSSCRAAAAWLWTTLTCGEHIDPLLHDTEMAPLGIGPARSFAYLEHRSPSTNNRIRSRRRRKTCTRKTVSRFA